jgi:hypothetical protein
MIPHRDPLDFVEVELVAGVDNGNRKTIRRLS